VFAEMLLEFTHTDIHVDTVPSNVSTLTRLVRCQ
jgi:hypothetical protein